MNSRLDRVVVTGAGGFIGRALVERLLQDRLEVIAVSRRDLELPCHCVTGDLREPELLNDYLTADTTVIHMAGYTNVAGSVRDPQLDFDCNTLAFLEVLHSVRDCGARLVFPSSPAVFQQGQDLPLSETARKRPSSPYGAAKLACEGYAQAFHACYGVDVKIARLFNVYGPGMTKFAIHDFYRKLCQNPNHLEILGDGEQIRDYLYIDDTVEGLLIIAQRGSPGEDYNLASGQPIKTRDLARMVATAMGYLSVEISSRGESFPGDIVKWYADITKIRALGFQPTTTLAAGIASTASWFDRTSRVRAVAK